MSSSSVIVSRHPAAIEFIASQLHPDWHAPVIEADRVVFRPVGIEPDDPEFDAEYDSIPVVRDRDATPDDVRGKTVYGNLPLKLAVLADSVFAVEFDDGKAPRGTEYSLADMKAAGARLRRYRVSDIDAYPEAGEDRYAAIAAVDQLRQAANWVAEKAFAEQLLTVARRLEAAMGLCIYGDRP